MDEGYLDNGYEKFQTEAFARRRLRPSIKLTAKSTALLSEPVAAQVIVQAIHHSLISDEDDVADGSVRELLQVDDKGIVVMPLSLQRLLDDTSNERSMKVINTFTPPSIASAAPSNDDEMIQSDDRDETQFTNEVALQVSMEVDALHQPDTNGSEYKKNRSSHQNIDRRFHRSCKAASCKKKCQEFLILFGVDNIIKMRKRMSTLVKQKHSF